jgi:hypothetical protein
MRRYLYSDEHEFDSDALDYAHYDRNRSILWLTPLHGSTTYEYPMVSEASWHDLTHATSAGRWWQKFRASNAATTRIPTDSIQWVEIASRQSPVLATNSGKRFVLVVEVDAGSLTEAIAKVAGTGVEVTSGIAK